MCKMMMVLLYKVEVAYSTLYSTNFYFVLILD